MENNRTIKEYLSFTEKCQIKRGLRGHVRVIRENVNTKERTLWDECDNIIPISGYQWILMKMFGLHLDSSHVKDYENIGKDTSVIVPDLNNSDIFQIGTNPVDYTQMAEEISDNHFIQGFMIGNGGAGEDTITTKNTDYSFIKLRNPIPFQQTQTSLSPQITGDYLGIHRVGSGSFSKSYYIKKFNKKPHIYHSWYKDGQKWDYVDPVTQNDLGPNAVNGTGKTNRIESYANVELVLSEDDCLTYFQHEGSTQTAAVNELGLVAFDAVLGTRSIIERLYESQITELIHIIFDNNRTATAGGQVLSLVNQILTVLSTIDLASKGQSNINEFINAIDSLSSDTPEIVNFAYLKEQLSSATNIGVEACYNQNGDFVYSTDKFLEYLADTKFDDLTTDEAQRIKLITYYTFKTIPLEKNFRLIFEYRIYCH